MPGDGLNLSLTLGNFSALTWLIACCISVNFVRLYLSKQTDISTRFLFMALVFGCGFCCVITPQI